MGFRIRFGCVAKTVTRAAAADADAADAAADAAAAAAAAAACPTNLMPKTCARTNHTKQPKNRSL